MPLPIVLLTLCFLLLGPGVSHARDVDAAPTAEHLLSRYESYLAGLESVAFDLESRVFSQGGPFAEWTWRGCSRAHLARSAGRWRLLTREAGWSYFAKSKVASAFETEVTFDGAATLITVEHDYRDIRELPGIDEKTGIELVTNGGKGKVETSASAKIELSPSEGMRECATQGILAPLFGYLAIDRMYLAELLRMNLKRATVSIETREGTSQRVLRAATDHGTIALWFTGEDEAIPARLEMHKKGADLLEKTPMNRQKAFGSDRGPMPNLPLREWHLILDFKHDEHEGRVFPTGYVKLERRVFKGGTDFSSRSDVTFSSVRPNPPAADLEPTLPIPEGTQLHIWNSPGLKAHWSREGIVVEHDKAVAKLKAEWSSEGDSRSLIRRPIVLATTGFLAALVLFILVRRGIHRAV